MTNVLQPTERLEPQIGSAELRQQWQDYLVQHTNWQALVGDYVARAETPDDRRDFLADTPTFIHYVAFNTDDHPETNAALVRGLAKSYHHLNALGYLQPQTSHHAVKAAPTADLTEHIKDWQERTGKSMYYMQGRRFNAASRKFPTNSLKAILHLEDCARTGSLTNQAPAPIEAALWQTTNRLTSSFDHALRADRFSRYRDITITGAELPSLYGLSPAELRGIVEVAQHSYPPHLMRGLRRVTLEKTSPVNAQGLPLYGTVLAEQEVKLFMSSISDTSFHNALEVAREQADAENQAIAQAKAEGKAIGKKTRLKPRKNSQIKADERELQRTSFAKKLEDILDHELAHVAHHNAPITWLRRWEQLTAANPIPITPYAAHALEHRKEEGRVELFAEAVQVYRGDPLRLMRLSPDYFFMIDELMKCYDQSSVKAALNVVKRGDKVLGHEYAQAKRQLDEARQTTLNERLRQAEEHGSPLGRVGLAAAVRG